MYEKTNTYESMEFKGLTDFLNVKTGEMEKIVTDAGGIHKLSAEQVEEFRARNDELGEATKRWETLREMDEGFKKTKAALKTYVQEPAGQMPFNGGANPNLQEEKQHKSIGTLFTESESYKNFAGKHTDFTSYREELSDVDVQAEMNALKTTMTTAAGFAAPNDRTPRVVPFALRRPVVADLIPSDPTTLSSIRYMEETTFTNAAAGVSENAAKPESALAFTERTVNVEVIATYIPVTNQQLDDVPQIRGVIDNRLSMMIQLAEEAELLNGTGVSPRILGFYQKPNIQTQAKGADPTPDAIYKAFTLVRHTGFAEPTGVVIHPNDWQDIRLLRTVDGIYIWGSPVEPGPERIWGKPVIVTTAATQNTALTGDFQLYSHISRRMGLTIIVGRINDDLIKNKQTVLAEERLSLEIFRAAAFCTITGI